MFGENLTTRGLLEDGVHIGDSFRAGSAELTETEPRMPCYKLGLRFGRDDIIQRFLASGRSGFYLSVVREGEIGAGDGIEPVRRDPGGVTVADITRLYLAEKRDKPYDPELLARAMALEALPESWKGHFRRAIERGRDPLRGMPASPAGDGS